MVGFPGGSTGKESTCNAGELGSIPGLGRSHGEGKGYPLQYSGLENSMDYTVHEIARSQTRLGNFHFQFLRFKEIDTYSQNILVKTQNTKEEILKWSWKCHIKKRTGKTKLTIRLTADFSRATTATSGQWNNTFKVLGENYCQPRLNLEKEMATHSSILA